MPYEKTLIDLLKARDGKLYGRLLSIEEIARPLLSYTQGKFPYYTPHDFNHSITVQENLDWLIPDKVKDEMNSYEMFLLLVSAWLHDWGLIGSSEEDANKIREDHHIRTEEYFEKLHDKIGLSYHEALIAGKISKGHRKVNLYSEEYEDKLIGNGVSVRTRLLAALLRLADETDITHSRTPEVIYHTINPSGNSENEFKKHLSISGIGQLDEKHKIYLNAIARDPMGADAIRQVVGKIQKEINVVKSILSQYGIPIDVIELKLETRGFVDKPIGFEVDNSKIVDLLIGKHLYANTNVAIRELIQNALDSCRVRLITEGEYEPKIILEIDEKCLSITDNGMGMGFQEAKSFLSNVGSTFYKSDELQAMLKNKPYDPISNFGIGLLSTFLIADGLVIDTKKDGQDGCLFTIKSLGQQWKYEKGNMSSPGTKITLILNSTGKTLDLEKSLYQYFVTLNIPVWYKIKNNEIQQFKNSWSSQEIANRFLKNSYIEGDDKVEVITEVDTSEFSAILVRTSNFFGESLVVFNQGIFIKSFQDSCLDNRYSVILNMKKNLVDLHISRENIIQNSKWNFLLYNVYNCIFEKIQKESVDADSYIKTLSSITNSRLIVELQPEEVILENNPLLKSFYYNAPYPKIVEDHITYSTLSDILKSDNISFYNCASILYNEEVKLVCKVPLTTSIILNPYDLPKIGMLSKNRNEFTEFVVHLCNQRGKKYTQKDLRTLLMENAVRDENEYKSICPDNVRFATFGELKPLVVVYEAPKVSEKKAYLGRAYWGSQLLFWELLDSERRDEYSRAFRTFKDRRYQSVKKIKEQIVLLDSSDDFIASILRNASKFKSDQIILIRRYLKYLSYLPLVLHNISSCQLFIEVIDNLEKDIAEIISIARPPCIFSRMQPSSTIFLKYFDRFGMDYEEADD